MRGPTPRRVWKYVTQRLRLAGYFQAPGDGRVRPRIPAQALLWGMVMGHLLREDTFHGTEALVRSPARGALGVSTRFGDDTLAYFTERLDPARTRGALTAVLRQVKRAKAFAAHPWLGLALDGTTTTCVQKQGQDCPYCRPVRKGEQVLGYRHHATVLSVAGVGLTVPCDVEPYGPDDSEYAAGQRLLRRAVTRLGLRFADYVVADGEFATAPFLHLAGDLGLRAVVRLKGNLPELLEAAQRRYAASPPTATFEEGRDRVEVWDASDFDPWPALRWETVRVLRYRQTHPDGTVIEALWFTDWPATEVGSRALYRMAKSRWEIENQTFNVAKTFHGMEHLCHHQGNSIVVSWLILLLALAVERLYRCRYLHRGMHPVRAAIDLVRQLRISLGLPPRLDSS